MTAMQWAIFWLVAFFPGMALHSWAEDQCTKEDVRTGRRDSGALRDDYGSNRGWYWKWKIPSIFGGLLAVPGAILWPILILMGIGSLMRF